MEILKNNEFFEEQSADAVMGCGTVIVLISQIFLFCSGSSKKTVLTATIQEFIAAQGIDQQ
jgi:hypothetical protein